MDNEVISAAASTEDVAASYDDEFIDGFSEAFGMKAEEKTDGFEVVGEIGDPGEPGEPGVPETEEAEPETEKETEDAESTEKDAESEPEMISFKEAGKEFSAPKEAVEAFAKAVGRSVESIIDVYQKGCNYDKLNERLGEALKDSEAFEKIALTRNMSKEMLRTELLAQLERAEIDNAVARIKAENPGINEEVARELAKFRINEQKPKAPPVNEENKDSEETAARLREVEMFQAKHPELPALPNEVIELWEKSGISLEKAFEGFQNKNKVEELEKKIAALEKENMKKEQKVYAKETSPGSANSAAGKPAVDPFVEGLFAKY